MRPGAKSHEINPDFESAQFNVEEAIAQLQRAAEDLAKLQGRVPRLPAPSPEPARKPAGTDWVSMTQAAEIAGVHLQTIWRWCNYRGLPCTRPGGTGRPRIRRSALKAFIER